MLKKIVATIIMTTLVFADAPVLRTGQVKSYDKYGVVVSYGTIKDDGYYRAGAARSYSHNGNVVIDNATGLEWQDNESIIVFGFAAAAYCTTLPLAGGDWRLPKMQELQTLVDYSQYNPVVTEGIFSHIFSSDYWSSTRHPDTRKAWAIDFHKAFSYPRYTTDSYYVRCVRGGPMESSNLSRNDETEIVTDSATGLQWQDDTIVGSRTWREAIDYCEKTLKLAGYDDWRLPSSNELLSIVGNSSPFDHSASYGYWSSTTYPNLSSCAFYVVTVPLYTGGSGCRNKFQDLYVRCVRGGQINVTNPSVIMYLLD